MATIGLAAVWAGGVWFTVAVAVIAGLMVWELASMAAGPPWHCVGLGIAAAAGIGATTILPIEIILPFLGFVVLGGIVTLRRHQVFYLMFVPLVLVAAIGLILRSDDIGLTWILWLFLVVLMTDISGYFSGRMIGGRKFWPKISPQKTWAGLIAGWIGAACIGWGFATITEVGGVIIVLSILLSLASQIGDFAESAMKRRMGVKDSSALLPGHGGVFDRLDGLLGAILAFLIMDHIVGFSHVSGG